MILSSTDRLCRLSAAAALAAAAVAQGPNFLVSYSQPENTASGSGGTVLGQLLPNEIAYLDFVAGPCPGASAEKWLPRTAAHVMAGDENGDGTYFNPAIFGNVDALLAAPVAATPVAVDTQRSVFWSVSAPIGNTVSATPFRPGDVARIVRNGFGDGQVEHFMRQEQFNIALGRPPAAPIDVDAIAFQPNFGVWFSIDVDTPCNTACGPVLVRDGDVVCIPGWALGYTPDLRIAAVAANSAVVVHPEAQMDLFTVNAGVTDRFGVCLTNVLDVEALEIDLTGPTTTVTPCAGFVLPVPTLLYTCETGTGASVLTTRAGGQIYNTLCGPAGTACSSGGPTWGPQFGVRPASTTTGAASHVDGLAFARSCNHVLEPQQHVMNVFPFGAPFGANQIDYNNPFVLSLILIELVPPVVAPSFPAFPFSLFCFPDLYAPSIFPWTPVPTGWGSFPMPAIPPGYTGKVLFQGVGFGSGSFELSTPTVIDVQ